MASIPTQRSALVLTQSKPLRLVTLVLFYFTQGFPTGLFFYAIPPWMAASGATTGEIAGVVSVASLPWSLKFVNGFLIDRYTFLPMGRRRAWIIGAQSVMVLVLLAGALLAPAYNDVFLLALIGFCSNAAVTFQDVGIDSLAVDIMPEDERAKAGGIMGGAQLVGIALTTAAGGYLLDSFGITFTLMVASVVPALVMLYGIVIREREGERRLPWTAGKAHPRNLDLQVAAWWPLLRRTVIEVLKPLSLLFVIPLLLYAIPSGGFESFHPILFQQTAGWEQTEYTNFTSTIGLASGIFAMLLGGAIVDRVGSQRALTGALVAGLVLSVAMGCAKPLWSNSLVLAGYVIGMQFVAMFYFVSQITMAMRMCVPAIAATQFTIYMALGNLGRPIGASLAGVTAGAGSPQLFYWTVALLWAIGTVIVLKVTFPRQSPAAEHAVAEKLPQGDGPHPIED